MNAMTTENTPNNPNSLDIIFQWVSKNNMQHMIQLTAARNLATDCSGIKNRDHLHSWKLPNCRFFKRYPPDQWTYSLIFQPNYLPASKMMVPMGPQQASVTVPITIFMNTSSTITTKRHRSQEC
ncbi:uncharacterized protein RHIMIDRAFT_273416 [Rhizopus microsporus ATCC 52813]|uniref:Uncharacterized protein n=2 Tax=Rhizopus microsporus TaxID=58291 RepID=A0A2G4T408_RHIZD|nr:uncharacterized protein RHIMIDRAFT_273416 [Rhizopus microsporus ATCC 52813]PHZ15754.1 hypothetical protein RHIMIDRAFT_273416 [Rhizopus microsporus ATCC 52813]